MIRRPPTRIELKVDDIAEYEQVMKERQTAADDARFGSALDSKRGQNSPPKRKLTAAERIGIRR